MARDFSNRSTGRSVKDDGQGSIWSIMHTGETNSSVVKDTSFNVGTDDVAVDIKVDPDELSLWKKKTNFKPMTLFNRSTTRKLNQDSRIWRSCHFSLSWRFQRLPRSGWPAKAASPAPPSGDREDGKRKYKRAPYIWTAVCGGLKQKWYLMCFKSTGTPYVCCQDWPQCWTSDVLHLNIWSSISLLKQCSFTFNTFILNSHLIRNSMKGFINVYQCQKSRCQLHKDDELRWTEMNWDDGTNNNIKTITGGNKHTHTQAFPFFTHTSG